METSVSQPINRVDGPLKVTGRALYTAEHPVPNVAHAVLIMSTIPKGRAASMDTSAAGKSPGVLRVFTPFNAPKLPPSPSGGSPTSRKLNLLQDDQILYSNQPIGLVLADTFENATRGAELVHIRYAPQPFNVVLDKDLNSAFTP